ncbi:MAG: type II toxin-antitoxin system prevent-host-death family antitoxin [Cyanobacteria bacterium J06614_10]
MTEQLATLIRQAEALPVAEQLALIAHLTQKMKLTSESTAIQETLYLTSIPGMVDSIKQGGAEPIEDCTLWSHYE